MTDIFLAYDSGDRSRARPVREALIAQGFAVSWDQEPPAGVAWEAWVRRRLEQCKCVVMLRSAASVQSNRLSHVASVAEERSKLIVVRLERSIWQTLGQPPATPGAPGQTAPVTTDGLDLANWSGDTEHPGWQELIRRIESKLKASLWVQRLMHDVEAERARWHAQYQTSAARCRALNAALANERSERDAAQDKAAGLQAMLEADSKTRLRLQSCIAELEQRLSGADGKHAEARQLLNEELRQKGTLLAEAEATAFRERDEAARLRAVLATAEQAHLELSTRIADRDAQLAAVTEARDAHAASIVRLEAGIAEREAELERLRATIAENEDTLASLAREHDAKLAELVSERDAKVADLICAHDARLAGLVSERDAEVAGLKAGIAERAAEVDGLRSDIAERDAELARLREALAARDVDIAGLKDAVSARDAEIGSLKAIVAQRDTDIGGLRADLAGLMAGVAERDRYMADLEASVSQRDAYIASLTVTLADRRAYMSDLEASIAQRDTHIADLKSGLAERDTQIAILKAGYKEPERRGGRHAGGVTLPALSRVTLPAMVLAGVALSILQMRLG